MSNNNSTTNVSFLSLLGKSVTIPLQTSVSVAEIGLDLVQEGQQALPILKDRIKGVAYALDAALISVEAAAFAAVNAGLAEENKLSKEDWRDSKKREDAIFSLFSHEDEE